MLIGLLVTYLECPKVMRWFGGDSMNLVQPFWLGLGSSTLVQLLVGLAHEGFLERIVLLGNRLSIIGLL